MYECTGCFENCHMSFIPWWGNRCLAKRVSGECFTEFSDVKKGD